MCKVRGAAAAAGQHLTGVSSRTPGGILVKRGGCASAHTQHVGRTLGQGRRPQLPICSDARGSGAWEGDGCGSSTSPEQAIRSMLQNESLMTAPTMKSLRFRNSLAPERRRSTMERSSSCLRSTSTASLRSGEIHQGDVVRGHTVSVRDSYCGVPEWPGSWTGSAAISGEEP